MTREAVETETPALRATSRKEDPGNTVVKSLDATSRSSKPLTIQP